MFDNQINILNFFAMTGNLTLVVVELHFMQILVFWCRAFRIFAVKVKNI